MSVVQEMSLAQPTLKPARLMAGFPLAAVAESLMMYRFTVDQYQRLIDSGILPEDGTYELLHGIVLRKDNGSLDEESMGHNPPHALIVALLSALIARINGPGRHLRIQLPLVLGEDNAPEPDGSIVRGEPRQYATRLPGGTDTYCVIEAAHSSLDRDQNEKLAAYAAAAIPQYVLINLQRQCIEEYTQPDQAGTYNRRVTFERGETLSLNLGNGEILQVNASDLLP
jgi:Uma2 family endonuclease